MLQLNQILFARDFSSVSDQALRYAVGLAQKTGASLHLLYAEVLHEDPFGPVDPGAPGAPEDQIRKRLRQDVDGALLTDKYPALKVQEGVERDIAAAPAILNYAADHDIDLIVMGTHGRRGVRRLLLGSVAEEVVRRADRPVLTVRQPEAEATAPLAVERILVPIDFSDYSKEALRYACEVAGLFESKIDLLHVVEESLPPAFYVGGVGSIYDVEPDIENKVRERLRALYEEVAPSGSVEAEVHAMPGKAAREISQFVEENGSDLVVMSTHGQTGLEHFLLGSVAEKVVRHVTAPVFTVKAFGKSLIPASTSADAAAQ